MNLVEQTLEIVYEILKTEAYSYYRKDTDVSPYVAIMRAKDEIKNKFKESTK